MNNELLAKAKERKCTIDKLTEKIRILNRIKESKDNKILVEFSQSYNAVEIDKISSDKPVNEALAKMIILQVEKEIELCETKLSQLINFEDESFNCLRKPQTPKGYGK